MAFKLEQINRAGTELYLLYYEPFEPTEHLDLLTPEEQERFFSFRHSNRRMEFTATRILRHELFGFEHIHYDEHGAPFIEQEGYISVSHCKGVVGIAVNRSHQIGLDLEVPRAAIHNLAHKFLSDHEKKIFDVKDPIVLTKIWSAKEALYKLAGRKKILFSTQLLLEEAIGNEWKARIINPDHHRIVKLHIFDHQGMIISLNAEAIEFV